MKSVQISGELFAHIVKYFFDKEGEAGSVLKIPEDKEYLREVIRYGLDDKLQRMANHYEYTDNVKSKKTTL